MLHKLYLLLILVIITNISSAQTTSDLPIETSPSTVSIDIETEVVIPAVGSTQLYAKEREKFEQAKAYLAKGKQLKYAELHKELADYPLAPYLEYAYIAAHLRHTKASRVDAFLEDNGDSPLGKRLRYIWLENLRKRDRWKQFISYYPGENTTTEQQCFYQYARYRNGEKQQSLQQAISAHYQVLFEHAQTLSTQQQDKAARLPIIATGHLTTIGASVSDSVRDIYIGTLEAFPASEFPAADYIALGLSLIHI